MAAEARTRARRRRWAGIALVLAVLAAGLGMSAAGGMAVHKVEQRYAAQSMDRYTDDVGEAITDQMNRYTDTLTDLAAAIGAYPGTRAAGFVGMTSGLNFNRLPGASSVAFVVPATDGQVAAVQALYQDPAAPTLTLHPGGTGVEHAFVVYDRPLDGMNGVIGQDLAQSGELAEALRLSRDNRAVAVSRTYVLLKDRDLPADQQHTSFALILPVHDHTTDEFRGWVLMGVRGSDFLNQTLNNHARGAVRVLLADRSGGAAKVIASVSAGGIVRSDPLNRERTLNVGQRSWELAVYPTSRLLTATDRRMSLLALLAGLVVTVLLTTLVGILSGARNRA